MYYRLTHILQLFIAPLVLAGACLALIVFELLPTSLHNFSELLVWVFALTGGLLVISYARTRILFALVFVLLSYGLVEHHFQRFRWFADRKRSRFHLYISEPLQRIVFVYCSYRSILIDTGYTAFCVAFFFFILSSLHT